MTAEANITALRMLKKLESGELNDLELLESLGGSSNVSPQTFHEGITTLRDKRLINSQMKPVPNSHLQRIYNQSNLPDSDF
jgi:hypothetical protein